MAYKIRLRMRNNKVRNFNNKEVSILMQYRKKIWDKFKSNLSLTQAKAKKLEGEELELSKYPNLEKIQIC